MDGNVIAAKLDEARALIERGWCQKLDAMNTGGTEADPLSESATCFCINGALFRAARNRGDRDYIDLEPFLECAIGLDPSAPYEMSPVIDWNDAPERTQAEVIEAFRKAAELARAS